MSGPGSSVVSGRRRELADRLSRPGLRLRRLGPVSWIALAVLVVIALAAVLASVLAPYGPLTLGPKTLGPGSAHPLGTDQSGRDILSRLMYGARWSLAIGLGATVVALVIGAIIGSFAATSHRAVDEVVMRLLDIVMAFPGIALAAVLVLVLGHSIPVLIISIGFVYMPSVARLVRANVLAQYSEDYVDAERILGARRLYIVVRHVAINCAVPVLVFCTVMVADAIVFEASLSFIGAGIRPPNPSWGSVLSDGKDMILTGGWWATLFPGLVILLTALSLNILSEGISDALAAPAGRAVRDRTRDDAAASDGTDIAADADDDVDAATTDLEPHPAEVEVAAAGTGPGQAVDPLRALSGAERRLRARARTRDLADAPIVLDVADLTIRFPDRHGDVAVVEDVSLQVRRGEVLGLIGESGCGKSLTSLAIMGLLPPGAVTTGTVRLDGADLTAMSARERRSHLGRDVAMIYQDALSSLNPAMTVSAQLKQFTRRGGTRTPAQLMELVGLDPDRTLRAYPHELSGGQRQRVLIAMALSRSPKLIVADEPTTALDVTVQAQVMKLLLDLREDLGFALVLVSHDLALVADVADRVTVMYAGQVAESGPVADIIGRPRHHYTRGLLSAVTSLEAPQAPLRQIAGVVPSPRDFPAGCRFSDRCPAAVAVCGTRPALTDGGPDAHRFACHVPAPLPDDAPGDESAPDPRSPRPTERVAS